MRVDDLSPEASAFLTAALAEFLEKQQWLRSRWPLEVAERWGYDQARGTLEFTFDDGTLLEIEGEPLGSFTEADGRWEWAWHNPDLGTAVEVREIGDSLDIYYLKHGRFPLPDRALIPYLAAIGLKACGADGAYIGDTGEMVVVFVLRGLRELDETEGEGEAEPMPGSARAGIPSLGGAAPGSAAGHAIPYEPGRWVGEGSLSVVVVPEPIEVEAELNIIHGPSWRIEQRIGDYRNTYALTPLARGAESGRWEFVSDDFGVGKGRFTAVDETLLCSTEGESGQVQVVESLRRTAEGSYEARGALFLEGERFAAWSVTYRRAG